MPQAPCLTPSPAVLPTAGSAVSTTISTMPPGPPRYCPAPAGHCPLRAGRRQRLDDRLDDLLAAVVGGQGDWRAGVGPYHGARLGDDLDWPKGAVVFRGVRVDQIGQRDDDRGIHVRVGGI